MTATISLYPLAVGNAWTYKTNDGSTYSNEVTNYDAGTGRFTMVNSTAPRPVTVYVNDEGMFSDAYEAEKFVMSLPANAKAGDAWTVKFNANGFENMLEMKVKEAGVSKEVGGKTFEDVSIVEAESKMFVNGNWMSINFFTQYHYANGIGLILTTSSHGDNQPIVDYKLV
jgi:hypothetical protein